MTRKYDKGERRHKHVGRTAQATIEADGRRPRRYVGKCPNNTTATQRQAFLEQAIPGPRGERSAEYDRVLYGVHEGVVYEAQTSDRGVSYHAYPYKGDLQGAVVKALRAKAERQGQAHAFEEWVKRHVRVLGADR